AASLRRPRAWIVARHAAEGHRPGGRIAVLARGPVGRGANRPAGPSSRSMPRERSMIDVATQLVLLFAACVEDGSTFTVVGEAAVAAPDGARIVVEVEDGRATPEKPMPLPVRVVVTASDGTHPDGSGRGVYANGRFFAESSFSVELPSGRTAIALRSGPDY